MPIAPVKLFDTNPGNVLDFSAMTAGEIFNKSLLPRVQEFDSMAFLQEGEQIRQAQLARDTQEDLFRQQQDDQFLASLQQVPAMSGSEDLPDYAIPVPSEGVPTKSGMIKLSNYGYASDSSPDYNSNVARIGHSNNKLEDGVSAALTRSLAKRFGIEKGAMFEAVTADGKVLKRRYDDTVPTTYKGKPLPETVDLYDLKGSNSFGGSIVTIRPLTTK